MNKSPRFLIVLVPMMIFAFFAKALLEEDKKFLRFNTKNFPSFELNDLDGNPVKYESLNGIKLVNVWASWCITCLVEHPYLMELDMKGINIVGLNYKDEKIDALNWLEKYGNPYELIIHDLKGTLALDLGVTGAPETFLIDDGKVVAHYRGEVNKRIWRDVFQPIISERGMF